ncbi:MAG: hypothetical protein SO147_03045 [Clostridia bacterium]|nr:hypothetical protein [Clostridia bacterium]
MNYLQEILAFQRFNQVKGLSSGQISLWYAMMAAYNRAGWKKFFTVPSGVLMTDAGLGESGMRRTREGLIKLGLLEHQKARYQGDLPRYRMISPRELLQEEGVEERAEGSPEESPEVGTEVSPKVRAEERATERVREESAVRCVFNPILFCEDTCNIKCDKYDKRKEKEKKQNEINYIEAENAFGGEGRETI